MPPAQRKNALASWLALPQVERLIPHPSNSDFPMAMEEVMTALDVVAKELGWGQGVSIEDYSVVEAAVFKFRNVHGEAIELNQMTRENEKLQKQIEKLESLNIKAFEPAETVKRMSSQAQQADIASASEDLDKIRSMDRNNDGVVSPEEEVAAQQKQATFDAAKGVVQDNKTRVENTANKSAQKESLAAQKEATKSKNTKEDRGVARGDRLIELAEKYFDAEGNSAAQAIIKEQYEESYFNDNIDDIQSEVMSRWVQYKPKDMTVEEYKSAYSDKKDPRHKEVVELENSAKENVRARWQEKVDRVFDK
jgi:hypothetical protein